MLIFALAYLGRYFLLIFWENWKNEKLFRNLLTFKAALILNDHRTAIWIIMFFF